jgi:hypothetical protein
MTLTAKEARRLHDEAPSMTIKELRRLGELHGFGHGWLKSIDKRTLVRLFRRGLAKQFAVIECPACDGGRERIQNNCSTCHNDNYIQKSDL